MRQYMPVVYSYCMVELRGHSPIFLLLLLPQPASDAIRSIFPLDKSEKEFVAAPPKLCLSFCTEMHAVDDERQRHIVSCCERASKQAPRGGQWPPMAAAPTARAGLVAPRSQGPFSAVAARRAGRWYESRPGSPASAPDQRLDVVGLSRPRRCRMPTGRLTVGFARDSEEHEQQDGERRRVGSVHAHPMFRCWISRSGH